MEKVESKDESPERKRNHSPEEGEKKSDEETEAEVHSANNWEGAELGDDQRKAKFLRLMGAAKKEHKGKFVIGSATASKPRGRSSEEEKQLEDKLETQFQHRMQDQLHHRNKKHRGLGFDDDGNDSKKDEKPQEKVDKDDPDRLHAKE